MSVPKKSRIEIESQPLGWIRFHQIRQLAHQYNTLSNLLSLPRDRRLAESGMQSRRARRDKMTNIWIELNDLYHSILRIPAWTEKNHLADDLGINKVLVILFLGIYRKGRTDGFIPLYLLYLLNMLLLITPSVLVCDISQLQQGYI